MEAEADPDHGLVEVGVGCALQRAVKVAAAVDRTVEHRGACVRGVAGVELTLAFGFQALKDLLGRVIAAALTTAALTTAALTTAARW